MQLHESAGISRATLRALFRTRDVDGSGSLDADEYARRSRAHSMLAVCALVMRESRIASLAEGASSSFARVPRSNDINRGAALRVFIQCTNI